MSAGPVRATKACEHLSPRLQVKNLISVAAHEGPQAISYSAVAAQRLRFCACD